MHIYYGFLLKEDLVRNQERLELEDLENHCERSLKPCDLSSIKVSLFLLTGGVGIVNVKGCDKHWYLTSHLD